MTSELPAVSCIVGSVFESMLGLSLQESAAPWDPAQDRLTASVHLAGEWNGAVLLECTSSQACVFAATFLGVERPAEVDDVVRDVLGELANMIGGNLKSLLGRGIHLSMPSVVDGDYNWRLCGADRIEQIVFDCAHGVFRVSVISAGATPEP